MSVPRVIVFGLDCAPPRLLFEEWRDKLPHIRRLIKEGCHGPLRSCDPPITIPAWSCMLSAKSPADLGFYGFKNRKDYSYFEKDFVTSEAVKEKMVWDILGDHGKTSVLLGIPQTYPAFPLRGTMVSGFLCPSLESRCTYPDEIKEELRKVCPDYLFDVPSYRSADKKEIFRALVQMAESQCKCFEHLLRTKPWDFAMIMQIGTDRLQHCFWADWDTTHPLHDRKSKYKQSMLEYYERLDTWIGKILKQVGKDTLVLVVSDHGAKPMLGGIAINEWLIEKGYLKLKCYPEKMTSIEQCEVDWPATTAWGLGGYACRVYLNVLGREKEGKVLSHEFEETRDRIKKELMEVQGLDGAVLHTKVHTPEGLYGKRTATAPDLFVYFDDLNYRSLGSVGSRKIAHLENDQGSDGANHDYEGIFIASGPGVKVSQEKVKGLTLFDITPTILGHFGIDPDASMNGRNVLDSAGSHQPEAFTDKEKEALDERLRSLGYLG